MNINNNILKLINVLYSLGFYKCFNIEQLDVIKVTCNSTSELESVLVVLL